MYFLENELKNVSDGLELLWDISFDFGKALAKKAGRQEPCKFIMDVFPALGFGDILAVANDAGYELSVANFPWTELADSTDFVMFRGMLSGVISGLTNERIELRTINKAVSAGYLALHIS